MKWRGASGARVGLRSECCPAPVVGPGGAGGRNSLPAFSGVSRTVRWESLGQGRWHSSTSHEKRFFLMVPGGGRMLGTSVAWPLPHGTRAQRLGPGASPPRLVSTQFLCSPEVRWA